MSIVVGRRLEPHVDQPRAQQLAAHAADAVVVDQLTVVDHDHAPRHLLDVRHVVRGEEDGRRALLVEPQHEVAKPRLGDQVEADRGLVEEQDLGLVQHARGQLAAHPLAQRQRPHRPVEQVGGVEQVGQHRDPRRRLGARQAVDAAEQRQRLARRQLEPQLRALAEQRADAHRQLPPLLPRHQAEHLRGAAGRVQDAGQHLDRGRLAGAVRADVREPLAGLDGERDALHRLDVAEPLRKRLRLDDGHAAPYRNAECPPMGAGRRPAILCLHGVTGHGQRFRRLATDCLQGRRVLAPDLRGHGRSPWTPPWTAEQHILDLIDVLEAEGVETVDIVGHSFGGLSRRTSRRPSASTSAASCCSTRRSRSIPRWRSRTAEDARNPPSWASLEEAKAARREQRTPAGYPGSDEDVDDHAQQGEDGRFRFRYLSERRRHRVERDGRPGRRPARVGGHACT